MEVAATGILLITDATQREKAQVTGTDTNTIIMVFFKAIQNTLSANNLL